jgi:hypothetical protein
MREHVVAKNSVSNLGGINQVHLQETSLQMTLLWSILLKSIQQESSSRLNHALRLENIDHAIDVDQRATLVVCELSANFIDPFVGVRKPAGPLCKTL